MSKILSIAYKSGSKNYTADFHLYHSVLGFFQWFFKSARKYFSAVIYNMTAISVYICISVTNQTLGSTYCFGDMNITFVSLFDYDIVNEMPVLTSLKRRHCFLGSGFPKTG